MKLKRIGIVSAAVIGGVLYALLGLVVGAFFSLFALIGTAAGAGSGGGGAEAAAGALVGVAAVVLFPLIYGAMGFVGGGLMAALFNVVARWTGGLEIEVSGLATESVFD